MAPSAQGQAWSEILCCPSCSQVFCESREPISTSCGHVFCRVCALAISGTACPIDQAENEYPIRELPTNSALLSMVGVQRDSAQEIILLLKKHGKPNPSAIIVSCEKHLLSLVSYMRRANSERGGSVWSEVLSRTIQRKLVSVLCSQIVESNSRLKLMRTLRALAERMVCEQLLQQQASHSLSTQLWTTVRSRGCQFLGPAMQEDVLKLILLTLSKGALIARKTLVMYIVQTLGEDYPQVSKTCVGHVVQLLYRASCFNVIKRDGESSLMQLKEEFRTYEALRREHDAQIVGMAVDTGLRISPDQWSALLYGDQHHRSHMQSIIDKLQSPQSFAQGIEELKTNSKGIPEGHKQPFIASLEIFEKITDDDSWERLSFLLGQMNRLIDIHVAIMIHRRELKSNDPTRRLVPGQGTNNDRRIVGNIRFKTKMCRETTSGEVCARGDSCSFAHSTHELRGDGPPMISMGMGREINGRTFLSQPPPLSLQPNISTPIPGFPYPNPQSQIITDMQAMTLNPMIQLTPFVSIPAQAQPMQQGDTPMIPMMVPIGAPGMTLPLGSDGSLPLPPLPLTPGSPLSQPIIMMHGRQPEVLIQPNAMWNGRPVIGQRILSQAPPPPPTLLLPSIPQTIPWIHQVADYPTDSSTPGVFWPGPPHQIQVFSPQPFNFVHSAPLMMAQPIDSSFEKSPIDATELLHLRRVEILNRLVPLASLDEEGEECDGRGHVSYTVASSVLDDTHRHSSLIGIVPINNGSISLPLELAPVPTACNVFTCNTGETLSMIGDMTNARTIASVIARSSNAISTGRTVCPQTSLHNSSLMMATVQADCSRMTVKDAIRQPLTATIITPHVIPHKPSLPNCIQSLPPRVIRPLETPMTAREAQHFVSQTLDKIVDVKERLVESGGSNSSVENEQLRVELLIADRQMETLDPHTQQTCLLKELEEVEKKIEELQGTHPPLFTPSTTISTRVEPSSVTANKTRISTA